MTLEVMFRHDDSIDARSDCIPCKILYKVQRKSHAALNRYDIDIVSMHDRVITAAARVFDGPVYR